MRERERERDSILSSTERGILSSRAIERERVIHIRCFKYRESVREREREKDSSCFLLEREIVRDTLSERGREIHTFRERERNTFLERERERGSPSTASRPGQWGGAHPCYPSQREIESGEERERERENFLRLP